MRSIILGLICIAAAQAAHVQTVKASFSDTVASHTIAITPTTGSAVVLTCISYTGGSTNISTTAVSDNQSGSWTFAVRDVNTSVGYTIGVFVLHNATNAARTITCTPGAFGTITLFASEYSGIVTTSAIDGTPVCGAGTGTAAGSGNTTTSQTNTTLYASIVTGSGSNGTDFTGDTGYTVRSEEQSGATVMTGAVGDRQVTSTGTYSHSWTISISIDWLSCIVALKETGGSTPLALPHRRMSM